MFGLVGGARGTLAAPVMVAAVVVGLAALVVPLLGVAVAGAGPRLRAWRRRRVAAGAERRARATMSEMCPHGWWAQITMEVDGGPPRVAVDWAELSALDGEPIVSRRVWGQTIDEALDAMVRDRRTDETLERIEREAVAHGARWPE